MKKFASLVIIVLALSGYYVTGIITEHTLTKNNRLLTDQIKGVSIAISEYKRHWFNSNVVYRIKVLVPARVVTNNQNIAVTLPKKEVELNLPITIYHGPVVFRDGIHFDLAYARTKVILPAEYLESLNLTSESERPAVSVKMYVNYLSKLTITTKVPSFKLIFKEGETLQWLGSKARFNISKNIKTSHGEFNLEGISVTAAGQTLALKKLKVNYDLHQKDLSLYLGNTNIELNLLRLNEEKNQSLEVQDFHMFMNNEISNGLLEGKLKLTLNKVLTNGTHYGPMEIDFSLKNLDAPVLMELNHAINEAQSKPLADKRQVLMNLLPELPRLLNKGAEFNLSTFHIAMPEGKVEASLLVKLPKGEMNNPFELLQKIDGNGKLSLPISVVQKLIRTSVRKNQQNVVDSSMLTESQLDAEVKQRFNNMLASGILLKENDSCVISLSLNNGHLMVNDKPFSSNMVNW